MKQTIDDVITTESGSVTQNDGAENAILIGTGEVARLMGVSPNTLRNYVWLQTLTEKERIQKGWQSPPKGMPRPEKVKGRNMWPARIMRRWALEWAASDADPCKCNGQKTTKEAASESEVS